MRISKLSERAGLPVGTVKFYLRSGLLHSGRATSATQARYDESHLTRLRTIRALLEVGRLPLADIQRILDAADLPIDGVERALAATDADTPAPAPESVDRARALLADLGWRVAPDSPHLPALARTLEALTSAGVEPEPERLRAYADAAAQVAHHDLVALRQVPDDQRPALLAVSSVLVDPLVASLRRLAREHQDRGPRSRIPGPRVGSAREPAQP